MTKTEAHVIIEQVLHNVGDKKVYEALEIANKALSWECAHEKMIDIIVETPVPSQNEDMKSC